MPHSIATLDQRLLAAQADARLTGIRLELKSHWPRPAARAAPAISTVKSALNYQLRSIAPG